MSAACMKKLAEWVRAGRGMGHGSDYAPFIQIHRKNMPSGGKIHFSYLPFVKRYGHFLSTNEYSFAIFLWWLGVDDLREQFPCWPWPHVHPLYGRPDYLPAVIPKSRGTLDIASTLGIAPLRCERSPIRYVPTIDLMATVHHGGDLQAFAFAIKPATRIRDRDWSERDQELLALQNVYAQELGITCRLASGTDIPFALRTNLEILCKYCELNDPGLTSMAAHCRDLFARRIEIGESLHDLIHGVAGTAGLPFDQASVLFHHFLWRRQIGIDPREPWLMSQPPALTDYHWILEVWEKLFGEQHG